MWTYTLVRDSFWGRVLYHLSKQKLFNYPEEESEYIVPLEYVNKYEPGGVITVGWESDSDPENPKNWSLWKKVVVIIEICLLTTSVYMASAVYTPGIEDMMAQLGISKLKATLPLTMFVIGYGLGPMVLSPMSENAIFGRTSIYITTLLLFFIFQIPISLTNNINTLIILRFFSGVFASPAVATAGASMGDITKTPYLPYTLTFWCMSGLCGPSLGPLYGSILVVKRNWHWPFWLVTMTSGIAFVVLGWLLPETYEKTLLRRKAQRLRKITGNPNLLSEGELENIGLTAKEVAIETLWRPIEVSVAEPVVVLINMHVTLVYSLIYIWFEAFPIVFIEVFEFSLVPLGAAYISVIIGVGIGAIIYLSYMHFNHTIPLKEGREITPETPLLIMVVGSLFMPVGIFIFGWTASKQLHWIGPLIGASTFSIGALIIFQTGFNYLANSFPRYVASVFAGNNMFRSVIGGCFPLFGSPLYNNLATKKYPVGWGSSVLGFIALAMVLIPVLFYHHGPKLRARSKYSNLPGKEPGPQQHAR